MMIRRLANWLYFYTVDPRRLWGGVRVIYRRGVAWWGDRRARRFYPGHNAQLKTLTARRRSDTIFVFGAGASLYDISPEEWAHIRQHNGIGWNLYAQQRFAPVDMLIIRETHHNDLPGRRAELREYVAEAFANPRLAGDTLWIIQAGWRAVAGNLLVGARWLPRSARILRYHNAARGPDQLPGERFAAGITHGAGTLTDAVNLAYVGGWQRIVLLGVDLYDMHYFTRAPWDDDPEWVAANPDRSAAHPTVSSGIVQQMGLWAEWLRARGVELYVQNPRSLMTEVMPVYDWRAFDTQKDKTL
jgi:hypothetical protein